MDRPRTRYVEVSGAEVAYQVVGQGPLSMAMRKSSRVASSMSSRMAG
jgi:hypothetical protein